MKKLKIGLLEDELPHVTMVQGWLEDAGHQMFHSDSGDEFVKMTLDEKPDLLILDWQLPDCEGINILAALRNQHGYKGPVLFATSKDSEEDIVAGLTQGADDYLVKPLRKSEFVARLNALWRRAEPEVANILSLGPIEINIDEHKAYLKGQNVNLTSTEFKLACCILSNEGKLLSREYLLQEVWGLNADIDTRTVDIHMSKLRRALKISPDMGYCIKTIYRHGYRLEKLQGLEHD